MYAVESVIGSKTRWSAKEKSFHFFCRTQIPKFHRKGKRVEMSDKDIPQNNLGGIMILEKILQ